MGRFLCSGSFVHRRPRRGGCCLHLSRLRLRSLLLICGCDLLLGCVALLRVKSGSMLIRWLLARFLTGAAAVVLRWWFVCHRRRNCCVRCCCWLSFGTDSVGSLRCSLQTVALLLHCLDLWFFQICWDLQFSWIGADSLLSFLVTSGFPSRPFRNCPVVWYWQFVRFGFVWLERAVYTCCALS
jgi:hypothetical protein